MASRMSYRFDTSGTFAFAVTSHEKSTYVGAGLEALLRRNEGAIQALPAFLTLSIASTTAPAELPDITRGSRFCIKSVLTTPKWYMPNEGKKKIVISLLILLRVLRFDNAQVVHA